MRTIPLSNSAEQALIDDEDFELVSQFNWGLNSDGYVRTQKFGETIYLHRLVMGNPPCKVDHWKEPRTNCQKSNLRKATDQGNAANRKPRPGKLKGVRKRGSRWVAEIKFNQRYYHLGYFDSAEDAAVMYDVVAQFCFGEFARINGV